MAAQQRRSLKPSRRSRRDSDWTDQELRLVSFAPEVVQIQCCEDSPRNGRNRRDVSEESVRSRRANRCPTSYYRPLRRYSSAMTVDEVALRALDGIADVPCGRPEARIPHVTSEAKTLARKIAQGSARPRFSMGAAIQDCKCKVSNCRRKSYRDSSPPPSEEAIAQAIKDALRTPYPVKVQGYDKNSSPPPSESERLAALEDAGQTPFCRRSLRHYGNHNERLDRRIKFADDQKKSKPCCGPVYDLSRRRHSMYDYQKSSRSSEPNDSVAVTLTRSELESLTRQMKEHSASSMTIIIKKNRVSPASSKMGKCC
ncbi:hypothetical protein L596_027644 [Steinernema carpocapsae]|uniref:Uncharacterized protein n=1 Tax=Steinernema carpocapsae TaxID=34508 RepID=A0A4U5LW37_STECR|nr:hypothetical protein L596_027644 [Steinernema carpocapsae]